MGTWAGMLYVLSYKLSSRFPFEALLYCFCVLNNRLWLSYPDIVCLLYLRPANRRRSSSPLSRFSGGLASIPGSTAYNSLLKGFMVQFTQTFLPIDSQIIHEMIQSRSRLNSSTEL